VLGTNPVRLTSIDVRRIGASLSINGQIAESGTVAAVMSNRISVVACLSSTLHCTNPSIAVS